jgi:hypothetical protein
MGNAQRALWTFLIYALVAPFFAALAVIIVVAGAAAFGLADVLPGDQQPLGQAVIATFVWSGLPAVATGLVLAGVTLRSGGFGWMLAAAIAVIAFAGASLLLPFGLEDARPYLAFLAGLVAITVRAVLVRLGIIAT